MADPGWFVLGGTVLGGGITTVGLLAKGWLDYRMAEGKTKADREARAEARRDKRIERRDDLQRQTLLDLQTAILELARATAKGHHADFMAERAGGVYGKQHWPEGLAEEARMAHARVSLLTSRVRNDDLRALSQKHSSACTRNGFAKSGAEGDRISTEAAHMLTDAQAFAGKLIREMDDLV